MILIGLGNKKQVGKDEVAKYLVAEYGFVRDAFGDDLKKFAYMMGWDGKKDERGRRFLQFLGTNLVREYNPYFWIDRVINRIDLSSDNRYVITDVRFDNEIETILNNLGITIQIKRNTGLIDVHSSENSLNDSKKWDYIIDNNSSFDDLYNKIDIIMSENHIEKRNK